jgi:hypothetical protein
VIREEIKKRLNLVILATLQSRTFYCLVCGLRKVKIRIYKTVILFVVLYGCETLCLTVTEEQRLRVARRIFVPKRAEVTGGWRGLHNEELHNFYSLPSIIRIFK